LVVFIVTHVKNVYVVLPYIVFGEVYIYTMFNVGWWNPSGQVLLLWLVPSSLYSA